MYGFLSLAATLLSISSFVSADPVLEERASSAPPQVSVTLAYAQPSQTCVAGIHIIVARASEESQGEGIIGSVASQITKMVPGSDSVAVVYPATESAYPTSEQEGVVGMKQLVTDYVNNCPGHWIALLGYSQGAQVVADTVVGSDEKGFSDYSTNSIGLGSNYLNQIAAMIQMGDPGFTPGAPGHVGTASKPGLFPRQNNDAFAQYNLDDKIQSYCDTGDVFCAGGTSLSVHVGYVGEYGSSAASFVASKFSSVNGGGVAGAGTQATSSAAGSTSRAASSAMQTSAAATSASRAATSAGAAGGSSRASSAPASVTGNPNPASVQALLTSQRYTPTTTALSGTFTQLANPVNTAGAAQGSSPEKGVAAAVFGAAIAVMGIM